MSAVLDASAVLAFFQGKAPELLSVFSSGDVVVTDVTIKNVEWALIQAGGKKLEVRTDLAKLGLEVVEFNEKLLESTRTVSKEVSLAAFEETVGAALAIHKKVTFYTGSRVLAGCLEPQDFFGWWSIVTVTLEGFAQSAAYQTQLENDKEAVSRLFQKIPKEFHGSVVFTTADYNDFFVMGFRLTIDGNRFVALNSRHHPSVYSFELFHDGFRFVEPIYNPEGFSRRLAEEYNKNVIKDFQSFWKFAAILFLFGSGIGLVAGSTAGGIIVGLVFVLVGFIIARNDINRFDVDDVRLGVNTPLRESTLEALKDFHQSSSAD